MLGMYATSVQIVDELLTGFLGRLPTSCHNHAAWRQAETSTFASISQAHMHARHFHSKGKS